MENAPGKENTFPRLYAGSGRVPEDTARRVVFASWALLEPTEGHTDAPAAAAVREELMRCVARGEPPVLCLYAGEDPAWFAAKGGWLAEDNLRCFLRYAGRAARAFGHLTDEYITLFEPNELVWKKSANRNLNLRFKMLSHMACAHVPGDRSPAGAAARGQRRDRLGVRNTAAARHGAGQFSPAAAQYAPHSARKLGGFPRRFRRRRQREAPLLLPCRRHACRDGDLGGHE